MSRLIDEIDQAVAAGHGRILLVRGGPGSAELLAEAHAHVAQRRPEPLVVAGGFDVAGARGDFVVEGESYADPDALLTALRSKLDGTRTVVLTMAELDLGIPTLNWADYFLLRGLPLLLSEHRLLVIATVGAAGVDQAILGELADRELLRIVERPDEPVDATAGDDARDELRRAFAPLGEEAAGKGYELALRFLQVAALEGREFTVAALALVLGEDEDALSDLFDDHLSEGEDAPLEGLGFFAAPSRSLYRYAFRSERLWQALHPVHGTGSAPPVRRDARRYDEALLTVYGPSKESMFRVWSLAQLAGDGEGQPFSWLANSLATVEDRVRGLATEVATFALPTAPRTQQSQIAAIRRLLQNAEVAGAALAPDDLVRCALLTRTLLTSAEEALAPETRPRAWLDVYELLANAARRSGWAADLARCEALRLTLVDPTDALNLAHQTTVLAEALLALGDDASPTRLSLAVPWLDVLLLQGPEARLERIDGLLNEASGALSGLDTGTRSHTEAHVLHARAGIARAKGEPAREYDERALALLPAEVEDHCGIRASVLAALA